jgi:broad specificity phosphatase PhoE
VRRLVLLRHGRTAWNDAGRAQGHADVPLDDVGEVQAKTVAPVLAALSPVALWSSDLSRAAQTAAHVAAESGLTPVLDARLREFDIGPNRTGLTSEQYAARFPEEYAALLAGEIAGIPGRETDDDVLARFLPAITSYADSLAARRSPVWRTAAGRSWSSPRPPGPAASSAGGWRRGTGSRPRDGPWAPRERPRP